MKKKKLSETNVSIEESGLHFVRNCAKSKTVNYLNIKPNIFPQYYNIDLYKTIKQDRENVEVYVTALIKASLKHHKPN